jgi:uncharacterized protein YkwD
MPAARLDIRLLLLAALTCAALALTLLGPPDASARRRQACNVVSANATPATAGHRTLVRSTLCLLNRERTTRGQRKLRLSKRLSRAAKRHSRDMVRRNYFSHNSLSGASFIDRIRGTGYMRGATMWMVGENLAWGSGRRSSPRMIVQSWMRSPGHRRNILTRRFRHIGIGIVFGAPANVGGRPAATYSTEFGVKR